jgi:hypothetical protein
LRVEESSPEFLGADERAERYGAYGEMSKVIGLRWLHAQGDFAARAIKADALERLVDLFERLLTEVRNAQQVVTRALQQVVNRKDASLFEAVGRADRQADLGGAHIQTIGQITGLLIGHA